MQSLELAKRFRKERAELARRRTAGEQTRYLETMYVLDLALDERSAAVPTRPVPWGRFGSLLNAMNLE